MHHALNLALTSWELQEVPRAATSLRQLKSESRGVGPGIVHALCSFSLQHKQSSQEPLKMMGSLLQSTFPGRSSNTGLRSFEVEASWSVLLPPTEHSVGRQHGQP
jgi:hypothetical protein